MAGILGMEK